MTTLFTTKDELIQYLANDPTLDTILTQIQQLADENIQLKSQLAQSQLQTLQLTQQLALHESKINVFDTALEQETQTVKEELEEKYTTQLNLLTTQVSNLDYSLSESTTALTQTKARLGGTMEYMDKAKDAFVSRGTQLYYQLLKYQRLDSLKIAKTQLENDSRAYITLDKLGSQFHLDTIQGSNALPNVTSTTQSLAAKGETNEVLCTQDQVRMTVSGRLFDNKSLGDVRWYRSQTGSNFVQIPNAGGRGRADASVHDTYGVCMTYIPTVDDLNCTLRCQFVDSTSGATLIAEIGPVVPDKELLESAVEGYKKNELEVTVGIAESDIDLVIEKEKEFEKSSKIKENGRNSQIFQKPNFLESLGMGGGGGSMGEFKLTLSTKRIVIAGRRGGKKIQCKIAMDPSVFISAHSDSETGFSLYLFGNWINCNAPNRHQRDIILALTRLFIQQTRINDSSSESERHREKLYSSAWMLSLINSDHDSLTAMPKSKILGSQSLSIIQEDLNVGDIFLGPKIQQWKYQPDEVFLDLLQTNVDTVFDVLPPLPDTLKDDIGGDGRSGSGREDGVQGEDVGGDGMVSDFNNHFADNNSFDRNGDDEQSQQQSQSQQGQQQQQQNSNPTPQPKESKTTPDVVCVWVTRSEFEQNAILHTEVATIDVGPRRDLLKGQREAPSALLSTTLSMGSRVSFSMSSVMTGTMGSPGLGVQKDSMKNINHNATSTTLERPMTVHTAEEEYVPYDIDDVTPQLGGGKRGFDDIIIGGDSDDDDDGGPRTHHQRRSQNPGQDGDIRQEDFYGAPAFEVKIKSADEVLVDDAANTAKIKQIFNQNPLLTEAPAPTVNNGARGRRVGGGAGGRMRSPSTATANSTQPTESTTTLSHTLSSSPVSISAQGNHGNGRPGSATEEQ